MGSVEKYFAPQRAAVLNRLRTTVLVNGQNSRDVCIELKRNFKSFFSAKNSNKLYLKEVGH